MPRKKQESKRARKRVEVKYGLGEPQFIGYSGNVSRTGMMVRAIRVFAPGTILKLELKFPDTVVRLRGQVIWARGGSVAWLSTGRVGMGVTFLDAPPPPVCAIPSTTRDRGSRGARSAL